MAGTPTPGDVRHAQARRRRDAVEQAELKARRRAENERNRAAKLARKARLALPPEQRLADLASRAAAIEAKWTMPPAQVDSEEVKAAQRAAMTRIEVVEVVREITVEVPAPPLPPGSYTECEVCVGRGMRDRYGQVPAAAERLALVDADGLEVAVVETCPTHISFVRATAQQRGFSTRTAPSTSSPAAARPRT
ncbi:hypothetical protein [Streptomyces chilikensis]|uniref:hypothetical protein n=1 Tax=Streptomyces chilikensis TaxID=1194079 RepID=UPI00140766C9|nr:hypothetical protein [Streptomyces chilikensis]